MRILALAVVAVSAPLPSVPAQGTASPFFEVLDQELQRNFRILKEKADPAPYFISYAVTQEEAQQISASFGALQESSRMVRRWLDCSVRVGSREFDNTRTMKGDRPRFTASRALPIEDRPAPLQRMLWVETDRAWRAAAARFARLKSGSQMQAGSGQPRAADFTAEEPVVAAKPPPAAGELGDEWGARLRRLSAELNKYPGILTSGITLQSRRESKMLVTTEGTRLQHGRNYVRLQVIVRTKAADGQDLFATESFEAEQPAGLPKEETLRYAVNRVGIQASRLMMAPETEPYAGPALLSGRAAGVFFHEIFGHRMEGHRLLDDTEGQTFRKSLNTRILPEFLSVTFDPTRRLEEGESLFGWYAYDDEGVAARPVNLVENGVLKTFLLSRTPLPGLDKSNGHGRRQPGFEPVARQSTLILDAANRVEDKALRRLLLNEIVRQGKPYGLYFEEVTGGYTTTSRSALQAFTVIPIIVYRVFPDGRPDELVRGVDIVGTPLASLAKIIAASRTNGVFNGFCGAESGSVPVSAISPAVLVSEIEIQKKPNPGGRPPILGRPSVGGGIADDLR